MAANLMNVFKNTDLKNVGKSMSDVVSLAFKPNKKTGVNIKVISGRKIMAANLMNVFKNTDLKNVGKSMSDVVSLAFKPNKKTGAKIARAVLSDGTTLIKSVTASGVVSETIHKLPEIASVAQRNEVIRDLAKQKINQETIAAMLDVSQSTVSNVLRKK